MMSFVSHLKYVFDQKENQNQTIRLVTKEFNVLLSDFYLDLETE